MPASRLRYPTDLYVYLSLLIGTSSPQREIKKETIVYPFRPLFNLK